MKLEHLPLSQEPVPRNTLGSDLEWMLGSGQVDRRALSYALANEFFPGIYQLCLITLNDPDLAAAAALQTLVTGLLEVYRYQNSGHEDSGAWFYGLALEELRRARKRQRWQQGWQQLFPRLRERAGEGTASEEPPPAEAAIWEGVELLPEPQRPVVRLQALGWSLERIALALHTPADMVSDDWESALFTLWSMLQEHPEYAGQLSPRTLPQALKQSIPIVWPGPEFTQEDLERLAMEAANLADRQSGGRRRSALLRESVALVGVALVVLALLLGVERWLPDDQAAPAPAAAPARQETKAVPPSAASPPTQAAPSSVTYLAQPDESLESIAAGLNLTLIELQDWNKSLPDLEPGTVRRLSLPPRAVADLAPPPLAVDIQTAEPGYIDLNSTSDEIRDFLYPETPRWRNAWLDIWSIYYGPAGYVGPAFPAYHSQLWIQGEDWSMEAFGGQADKPAQFIVRKGKYHYSLDPENEAVTISRLVDQPSTFSLQGLVEPARADWFQEPGSYKARFNSQVGRRSAIVVDWIPEDPNPHFETYQVRMWIDREIGTILRMQTFGGPEQKTLIYEVVTAEAAYGREFTDEILPVFLGGEAQYFVNYYAPWPNKGLTEPAAFEVPEVLNQTQRKAPQGAGPALTPSEKNWAQAPLTFVYADSFHPDQWPVDEAMTATLYVGDILVTHLASPPVIMTGGCDRSPDGTRLAYITARAGGGGLSTEGGFLKLAWLDLTAPEEIHLPELKMVTPMRMSFAPDGKQLALFGYSQDGIGGQLFLYDLEAGEFSSLIEVSNAESLVWNPDGRYLALLAEVEGYGVHEAVVVDVNLGQIVYRTPVEQADFYSSKRDPDWPAADWPGHAWGVEFPQIATGYNGFCGER